MGVALTFQNVTPLTGGLRTPVMAPWHLGRGRTVVFLKTDSGVIEVGGGSVIDLKAAGAYSRKPHDEVVLTSVSSAGSTSSN